MNGNKRPVVRWELFSDILRFKLRLDSVLWYGIKEKGEKMPKLTISRVATEGGVNVETVRYYQRRGLLEEPAKPDGGYRNYPKEIVKRIRFIKRAQALGFTLEEVAELLQLDVADGCANSCDLAERKLTVIDQKIAELAAMRRALAKLMAQCDKKGRQGACPMIKSLQRELRHRPSNQVKVQPG
jgi:MerR family mercuric resistance operon transcriptional regulator